MEAVLQPQMQGGVLCGQRGVHRHEQGGGQEQPQYNPSFDRQTDRPQAYVVIEQRSFDLKLGEVLSNHGVVYFRSEEAFSSSYQGVIGPRSRSIVSDRSRAPSELVLPVAFRLVASELRIFAGLCRAISLKLRRISRRGRLTILRSLVRA